MKKYGILELLTQHSQAYSNGVMPKSNQTAKIKQVDSSCRRIFNTQNVQKNKLICSMHIKYIFYGP